jgi:hypothetical protein
MHVMARRISGIRGGVLTPREYRSMVVNRVAKLARRLLPDAELYRRSLGAFPTIVRESLNSLSPGTCHSAGLACVDAWEGPTDDGTAWAEDESDPIEAQWYFDMPSVKRLLAVLPTGARSLVALGVPSIGASAAQEMDRVRVVDRSKILERQCLGLAAAATTGGLEVVEWDLDAGPHLYAPEADVVVMDPPWYLEHYKAWLHTAVDACRIDGTIGVVLPQVLTNRCSVADRRELLSILRSIGHVSLKPSLLSYVTPSFERAVLDTKGMAHLDRWRQADMALVRLRSKRLPYPFRSICDLEWQRREICGRIVRSWDESVGGDGMPVIEPADDAAGYRLTSVSRFYLQTSGINLITSRGGAAVVSRWGRLPQILDYLGEGYSPDVAVKAALPRADTQDQQVLAATLELILRPHASVGAAVREMQQDGRSMGAGCPL